MHRRNYDLLKNKSQLINKKVCLQSEMELNLTLLCKIVSVVPKCLKMSM